MRNNRIKIRIAITAIALLIAGAAKAQLHVPPVFGTDSLSTRLDEIARLYIPPKKIMWISNDSLVKDAKVLLLPGTGQTELGKRNMCSLHTTESDTASILLDYGRELHGGLKLVLGSSKPWKPSSVRIRFGESVSEVCSQHDGGKRRKGYSTNDHAMRDMVLQIPSDGQIEIGNTGFRFVRIDLLSSDFTIHLKEAPAILRYRNIPYLGSFRCNDERLNEIWMTGAYTVHLNMQEYLWDGIKRDRLIWLGDMHPEVATIMSVFGYNEVVNKSIDLACEQFPLPQWLNGISTYSMWYLIIHHEWYMHNGNISFLQRHRNYITGVIDRIDECVDENGNETLAKQRFLDWPSSPNKAGVEAGCRALLCWAMEDAGKLCEQLGEKEYVEKCGNISKRLKKQIKQPNNLKQAAALMSIAGLMKPEKACSEVISVGGAKNFSTFYGYYMLQALAQAGEYQQAVDIIRQYWGGMLDLGATTFWEDFNLDWTHNAGRLDDFVPEDKDDIHGDFGDHCYPSFRHSFCHGWASGPTPWMTQHILGVEILDAGCKTLRITPHLGDLEWAEGTFPTPLGVVYIKHIKGLNGKITSTINAPDGITIK